MQAFHYRENRLHCEDVPVARIAREIGTPLYLYSQTAIEEAFRTFDEAFSQVPHCTCYAVKANSNLAILNLFHRLGAGFDIVSGGELLRCLRAGVDPGKVVFSGVGKTAAEMDLGLQHGIFQFNVESEGELELLESRARSLNKVARAALRINPDVDAGAHPYTSTGTRRHKFGIPAQEAGRIYTQAGRSQFLDMRGIGCHIGSQITRIEPFVDALENLRRLVLDLRGEGCTVDHIDFGGGLGITYRDERPPSPAEYARAVCGSLRELGCMIFLEPGRVIVGNAGVLATRVTFTKKNGETTFIVVDAGMNDLMRPSLYGSYHEIRPETLRKDSFGKVDVVGPVCESGDFFAHDRDMPSVEPGDLLAIMSAGAYGFVLSSSYNTRPRAPEVLVKGDRLKVIRERETVDDLMRGESISPHLEREISSDAKSSSRG